ncbi:MAG: hypothetical protein JSW11_19875 [Candidatus Heimdallarchaeota archaeon]|nr:MAG: hypothetical protein JSW11_19875 [Candidatus Heimdallarchaeota archaeon]
MYESNDSEDKLTLRKELQEISREKKILKVIQKYFEKLGPYDPKTGVSLLEFKTYLTDHGYSQLREDFLKEVESKIQTRLSELDRAVKTKSEKIKRREELETKKYREERMKVRQEAEKAQEPIETDLGSLKQILFIPSWRKMIEREDFKGFYLKQPVHAIIHDNVIFLPDFAVTGIEETLGEAFIMLTGVGVYYTQFRLTPGEIIDAFREITGIVLPLDIYERSQDLSGSIVDSQDLLMTEYMTTIPFSLFNIEQTKQMYLRGVIARNIYHPYKECFEKLLEICRDPNSLGIEDGLKVLSGGLNRELPLYTNEILTEIYISGYSRLIAGIKNIQPKLEKIISDLQLQGLKVPIFEKIREIKKDFVDIGYPRLLDWMP